jgi:hypothetical protein
MDRASSLVLLPVKRTAYRLYAWGRGEYGQLGMLLTPHAVQLPTLGEDLDVAVQEEGVEILAGCILQPVSVTASNGCFWP